jgi:hypothetical protein
VCVYIDEISASESCSKVPVGEVFTRFKKDLKSPATAFVHYLTFVLQMIDREQTKLAAVLYYCGK